MKKSSLATISVLLVLVTLACGQSASPTYSTRSAEHQAQTCTIVDSDASLDDLRALAVIAQNRENVVLVATGGISRPAQALSVFRDFCRKSQIQNVAFWRGLESQASVQYPYLDEQRQIGETMNGLISKSSADSDPSTSSIEQDLASFGSGCKEFEVLLIAPGTTFLKYWPIIEHSVTRVIMQGSSNVALPSGRKPNFNCGYDSYACGRLDELALRDSRFIYVDIPTSQECGVSSDNTRCYRPTTQMLNSMATNDVGKIVKRVHENNTNVWQAGQLMLWDDAAAAYLVAPAKFKKAALGHFEPQESPDAFRNTESCLITRTCPPM